MNTKLKQILNVLMWVGILTGIGFTLGFVAEEHANTVYKNIEISITGGDEHYFIQEEDVKEILNSKDYKVVGEKIKDVDVAAIERILNDHPSVENADVYASIDGTLRIALVQRKPIVRIINESGENFYIDENGSLMPLSDKYTARVLIVNGRINEPFARWYKHNTNEISTDTLLCDQTMLDDIYSLSTFILADPFWKAQIVQVFINEEGDIELVPQMGDQRIILGDIKNMEEKFNKLLVFYKEGLKKTGWWNKYESINLKYINQVVCSKKQQNGNI